MILYEIEIMTDVQIVGRHQGGLNDAWSSDELWNALERGTWTDFQVDYSSDKLEEAEAAFRGYIDRSNIRTHRDPLAHLLTADLICLMQNEYDEDGEFIQGEELRRYAEPIEAAHA